ncbi:unnamed protein product [Cochlearia groenlandica]
MIEPVQGPKMWPKVDRLGVLPPPWRRGNNVDMRKSRYEDLGMYCLDKEIKIIYLKKKVLKLNNLNNLKQHKEELLKLHKEDLLKLNNLINLKQHKEELIHPNNKLLNLLKFLKTLLPGLNVQDKCVLIT